MEKYILKAREGKSNERCLRVRPTTEQALVSRRLAPCNMRVRRKRGARRAEVLTVTSKLWGENCAW